MTASAATVVGSAICSTGGSTGSAGACVAAGASAAGSGAACSPQAESSKARAMAVVDGRRAALVAALSERGEGGRLYDRGLWPGVRTSRGVGGEGVAII